jgi:serine/threonine protein kinase
MELLCTVQVEPPSSSDTTAATSELVVCTVQHGNICRLFAFCTDGPHRCLLMELATGGSLEDRLACRGALDFSGGQDGAEAAAEAGGGGGGGDDEAQQGPPRAPLTWQHRVRVAEGVCSALAHLHGLTPQLVHRDVKVGTAVKGIVHCRLVVSAGCSPAALLLRSLPACGSRRLSAVRRSVQPVHTTSLPRRAVRAVRPAGSTDHTVLQSADADHTVLQSVDTDTPSCSRSTCCRLL